MSTWAQVVKRAQKAAIRFARAANETLIPSSRYVLAMEIEGVVIVVATGPYASKLANAIEGLEDQDGAEPFKIERPSAETIEQLVPTKVAA